MPWYFFCEWNVCRNGSPVFPCVMCSNYTDVISEYMSMQKESHSVFFTSLRMGRDAEHHYHSWAGGAEGFGEVHKLQHSGPGLHRQEMASAATCSTFKPEKTVSSHTCTHVSICQSVYLNTSTRSVKNNKPFPKPSELPYGLLPTGSGF